MSSTKPLRGIMDANRLTGPNFSDWLRNLKILLKSERIAYVLEGDGLVEPNGYYVAYKPITFSCILFTLIEMIFIHCYSCVMFAMKSMSMCNDLVNYDEIII